MSACELFSGSQIQSGFEFPQQLTEKYCPKRIEDFIGIEKAKNICLSLIRSPKASGYTFIGPSGTGKTSLSLALAAEGRFELHHIPSQSCTVDTLERVRRTCQYVPREGLRGHLVLVDEGDQMSQAAQQKSLSYLDGTDPAPQTIWIFTCNSTERFEPRFLSRTHVIEFSSYGIAKDVAALLERVWDLETDNPTERPNFARVVKENNNNIRGSLMSLETLIMTQGV